MSQVASRESPKYLQIVVALQLVLGLYFPTESGDQLTILSVASSFVCLVLIGILALRRDGLARPALCFSLLGVVPLLLFFTYTSGLPTPHLGGLLNYGILSVLLMSNIRTMNLSRSCTFVWLIVNIVNVSAGTAIVLGSQITNDFIIRHFSIFGDDLVPMMLAWHKPVLTFGSHSLAAFFFFLFFWVNWETYKAKHAKIYLILVIYYVVLIISLLSVSGIILGCLGISMLCLGLWRRLHHKAKVAAVGILSVSIGILWAENVQFFDYLGSAKDVVVAVLTNSGSGFSGRYVAGGTMRADLEYLADHPFRPTGASLKADLMVGDSGPIEYLLRGSLPLLILIYLALWFFLRRNLVSARNAYFLFVLILTFETGMTVLLFFRTLYLLPAFLVYLNNITSQQHQIDIISN